MSDTSKIAEPTRCAMQKSAWLELFDLLRSSRVRSGMFPLTMSSNDPLTGKSKPEAVPRRRG
jgi:hypothetical protein